MDRTMWRIIWKLTFLVVTNDVVLEIQLAVLGLVISMTKVAVVEPSKHPIDHFHVGIVARAWVTPHC
jgi:hypothetical protein